MANKGPSEWVPMARWFSLAQPEKGLFGSVRLGWHYANAPVFIFRAVTFRKFVLAGRGRMLMKFEYLCIVQERGHMSERGFFRK